MFVLFLIHFEWVHVLFYYYVLAFLLVFISFSPKYAFFIKSAISFLLANFVCFNHAAKLSAVNVLISLVKIKIYLPWS